MGLNLYALHQITYALVFYYEVKDIYQPVVNASDVVIETPQFGTKHSMNISVSCGVVVWDVFTKMKHFEKN